MLHHHQQLNIIVIGDTVQNSILRLIFGLKLVTLKGMLVQHP